MTVIMTQYAVHNVPIMKQTVQDCHLRLCLRRRRMKWTMNGQVMTKATVGMLQLVKRRHQREA